MIAIKLLWREFRSGRLGLISASLIVAVAVIAAVALVADRVQSGLSREVSSFLGADLRVRNSRLIDDMFLEQAEAVGLQSAQIAQFSSMVFFGDNNHLAAVKAVEQAYPLRGRLTIADTSFSTDKSNWKEVEYGPSVGEVWVEERLLPMLDMQIGDLLEVGAKQLKVTQVLIHEPDRGSGFSVIGARVMMNHQDLEDTGVILPGSRVSYSLLLSGNSPEIDNYRVWAEDNIENISDGFLEVQTPEESEERLQDTLDRGRSFLLLSGTVGLLLAAVALALSSQQYAKRQQDQLALMKSWGLPSSRVKLILFQQLAALGAISALIGVVVGWTVHLGLMWTITDILPQGLPKPGFQPVIIAVITGFCCLIGFALPALWHLPSVSPLLVLRRDVPLSSLRLGQRLVIGVSLLMVIILWYSKSFALAVLFIVGALIVAAVLGGLVVLTLLAFRKISSRAGSIWRLAIGNLWRRRWSVSMQSVAFSFTIMLLFVMIAMRTSLLADWRAQLPEDAPNHFLVNMMSWEVDPITELMTDAKLDDAGWFPMVRGRLVSQNGELLTEERMRGAEGLDREVNLTWASEIPETNEIVQGKWWAADTRGSKEFSLEKDVADGLGVSIGDMFLFNVGGREFEAELTSLRTVEWDSMRPNFYIIFPEGVLEDFSPNWITSTYLERNKKQFLNDLLSRHPTVLVVALDEIMERIRIVVDRISIGLELMLLMILICGVLVLFAAIASSFDERIRESAILRTLGSSRKLVLGALCIEFLFMGVAAGLVASAGAQAIIFLLQKLVFDMPLVFYSWIWLGGPVIGALVIATMGLARSASLVVRPPNQLLREAGSL